MQHAFSQSLTCTVQPLCSSGTAQPTTAPSATRMHIPYYSCDLEFPGSSFHQYIYSTKHQWGFRDKECGNYSSAPGCICFADQAASVGFGDPGSSPGAALGREARDAGSASASLLALCIALLFGVVGNPWTAPTNPPTIPLPTSPPTNEPILSPAAAQSFDFHWVSVIHLGEPLSSDPSVWSSEHEIGPTDH